MVTPVIVSLESPNLSKVKILIEKSDIEVQTNSAGQILILDRLYHFKELRLKDVNFIGVNGIQAFSNANIGKKIFAIDVTFNSDETNKCHTKQDSNDLSCKESDAYDPNGNNDANDAIGNNANSLEWIRSFAVFVNFVIYFLF